MATMNTTLITAVFASLVSLTAQALPPEHITIDGCVNKKSAVEFPHTSHFEQFECSTCHHTQENLTLESAEAVEPCSACHIEPKETGVPDCANMNPRKNAFHIQCMGCHKEHKGTEKQAPTKCDDCHPKN